MEERKYELVKDSAYAISAYNSITHDVDLINLYRIKALRDFDNVRKGDLGGYIEKEENLSQEGNCWVYNNAKVYGNARVYCNAKIYGNAKIHGNAEVYGNANVYDDAEVYDDANVYDDAEVYYHACVFNCAKVCGIARVHGFAQVYGNARVYGAIITDYAKIYGNAKVYVNAVIRCDCEISNDAMIQLSDDYCAIVNFGSMPRYTTFFKCKDDNIKVNCGCFNGTLDEFREKVKKTHKHSKYAKEYLMAADLAQLRLS